MSLIEFLPAVQAAASPVLETIASPILGVDLPDPDPIAPPGAGVFTTGIAWTKYVGYAIAVIALIVMGIMMLVGHHRGEGGGELITKGVKVLIGIAIISAATQLVVNMASAAG